MSEPSKQQQRPGATPIKNPLLSASVTGLTFDDFPNKPQLLPAAPPIVHTPPTVTTTAGPVTPSALLGRDVGALAAGPNIALAPAPTSVNVEKALLGVQNAIGRLTEEVFSMRQEIKRTRMEEEKSVSSAQYMLDHPLTNQQELDDLEEKLKEEQYFHGMTTYLRTLSAKTPEAYVRKAFHCVFQDNLAEHFTWLGTKQKKAAKNLNIVAAIREHKSLVTVGSSSLDTENLDEINLNSTNEDSVTFVPSDTNANPLLEQQPNTDSILSQAASSFSALPSVASNVFSSFSKRITAISSRETTPVYDHSASDPNANYPVPQLDIQPTYTQQQIQPTPEPFYAPPPPALAPQVGNYFGGFSVTSSGLENSQPIVPPVEQPKFYTPGEITTLPSAAAVPPPAAGGQNNFRFSSKKKLYAPIPGLSEQSQQPSATFDPSAISAPIAFVQPAVTSSQDPYAQSAYQAEERKPASGLFSKITNLAPTGVLQNISGLVQSAAGTITQTIKSDSTQNTNLQQHPTGITFDQQPLSTFVQGSLQQAPANFFAPPPVIAQQGQSPQAPAAVTTSAPASAATFFNPQPSGDLSLSAQPVQAKVKVFDPFQAPAVFDPAKQTLNSNETKTSGLFQDAFQPSPINPPPSAPNTTQISNTDHTPLAPPPSTASSEQSRPPSRPSRPPSQRGHQAYFAQPQDTTFFNPSQVAPIVPPPTSNPLASQPAFFNPSQLLQGPPQEPIAQPPAVSVVPPPSGGQTSFRLQKGTKLYKNPLATAETAPVQVTPNQIPTQPPFGNSFVIPTFVPQQSFGLPPASLTINQVPTVTSQGVYASDQLNQSIVAPPPAASNLLVPSREAQNSSLFTPFQDTSASTGETNPLGKQSVPIFANATQDFGKQSDALLPPSTTDVNTKQLAAEKLEQECEKAKQYLPINPDKNFQLKATDKVINPLHFFKPIEPVVESAPNQPSTTETSASFFGTSDVYQLFKPIEPVLEDERQIEELPQVSTDNIDQTLQKLSLTTDPNKSEIEPLPVALPSSNLTPASTLPPLSTHTSVLNTLPSVAPPVAHTVLGSNNPYRRGSASEASKPHAAQPLLANFFTPGPTPTTGDLSFFTTLPSSQNLAENNGPFSNQFFGQQTESAQNLLASNQGEQHIQFTNATEASKPTEAINFFTDSLERETKEVTASKEEAPQTAVDNSDCNTEKPQQASSFFATIPYPDDSAILQASGSVGFPSLPTNIGIIPSVQESRENLQKNQTEHDLQSQVPLPPIGFESFQPIAQAPYEFGTNLLIQQNTTQQNHTTTDILQQSQLQPKTKQQPTSVNRFSNYFNQETQPELPKDPFAFFDSFAGSTQVNQSAPVQASSTQIPGATNEDQRIQNFFNNPPPKDAYHAGDLNYDLIHRGLAVRELQQRSLTPISNLVEPPSSACSEFSNLTSDVSALETSILKEETKIEDTSPAINNHIKELPEDILKELRMANLLQTDKSAATPAASVSYKPVVKHWFYKRTVDAKQTWVPFSQYDSDLLETSLATAEDGKTGVVAVEGGRYDVNISERLKRSVYWDSDPIEIKRCSWFYKAVDSKYVPYDESTADILEAEYKQALESGVWPKTIILSMGEQLVFHGPTVIVHYQQQQNQDAWGGSTQTTTRPRVVRRDLSDFRIEQGESQKVDHLLFMVHGIGSACDLKLRSVEEVVDDFRTIAHQLVQSHYKNSTDLGLVGRVEVLPISWHKHLHSLELGIDEKLRSITLESIPKLRNFTNDTLLDILFYTSPTFAQKIMNSIVMSLNDIYIKYRQRHPDFNGGVSLAGHSLGSLIMFDLLCHQNPMKECEEKNLENPDLECLPSMAESSTEDCQMQVDSNQMQSKHIGYTMGLAGTGQPFINYGQLVFQPKKFFALGSPIGMFVTIRGIDKLGLDFRLPTCPGFYNIFHPYDPVAYRIEALVNPDLSGCRPVLIPHHKGRKRMHLELKETMARVSTDLKNKFLDTFKNTFDSVNIFGMTTKSKKEAEELMEKEVEKVIEMQMHLEEQDEQMQPLANAQHGHETLSPIDEHLLSPTLPPRSRTNSVSTVLSDDMVEIDFPLGKLNDSRRIDYVLQEAPLEFINEYIFALSSHVCYWESEDTILFVMKEIYSGLGVSPDSQVPQQTMTIERPSSRNSLSNA